METVVLVLQTIPEIVRTLRKDTLNISTSGLTSAQYGILYRVSMSINTIRLLAEAQGTSAPAISRMVDGLVKKKFLSRNNSPEDRRYYFIKLTEKGSRELENCLLKMKLVLRKRLEQFNSQEQDLILKGVNILKRVFEVEIDYSLFKGPI